MTDQERVPWPTVRRAGRLRCFGQRTLHVSLVQSLRAVIDCQSERQVRNL